MGDASTRYGEDHRAYHNLARLSNMLDRRDACQDVENWESVAWAIWFHDVVYDPQSSSNGSDSAILFRELPGSSFDLTFVNEEERLIMKRLLAQDTIYQTPLFANIETPARANIPDEIGHLSEKSN
ncbi:MAG: hypothetical protein GWQ05_26490 [Verrucomicrobiaceae bacterium]|nr:hypothetical protein [Verrucomicrobiaceae bacterium]NCF94478.1 hypothetical protein [Verrucomicrobiaceae bacterium]